MRFFAKIQDVFRSYIRYTDWILVGLCAIASMYGFTLVYSAAVTAGKGRSGYLIQLLACIVGLLVALVISRFDYEIICAGWPIYAGVVLILMILTFTPLGLNMPGTDDTAWLNIPGINVTFQPSELLKIVFIITFSKHLVMVRDRMNRPLVVLGLCLHAIVPAAMIFKQGDDGTLLVFLFIFVAMMFGAGIKPLYFLIAGILGAAAVPLVWNFFLDEDKKARFLSLFFVEEYAETIGWQQQQGLMAIGSGQLTGLGFLEGGGHGLYARNNDFIFTVAGEEFGFIGGMAVILILLFIVLEILRCAMTARDTLGTYICIGMMSYIGFQTLINLGMNLRVLPVIGITLPFFSAGGSSVATLYIGMGLVLSVYFSSRARKHNSIFTKPV